MNAIANLYIYLASHWTWLQSVFAGTSIVTFVESLKRSMPSSYQKQLSGAAKCVSMIATTFAVALAHVRLNNGSLNVNDLGTVLTQWGVLTGTTVALYELFGKRIFAVLDKSKQFDELVADGKIVAENAPKIEATAEKIAQVVAKDSSVI